MAVRGGVLYFLPYGDQKAVKKRVRWAKGTQQSKGFADLYSHAAALGAVYPQRGKGFCAADANAAPGLP